MTIREIADLDDWQLANVVCRPADAERSEECGVYWPVPDAMPDGEVERPGESDRDWGTSFEEMYRQRLRRFGFDEERIEQRWQVFLAANPGLRVAGEG